MAGCALVQFALLAQQRPCVTVQQAVLAVAVGVVSWTLMAVQQRHSHEAIQG